MDHPAPVDVGHQPSAGRVARSLLAQGCSLEEIGARAQRPPALNVDQDQQNGISSDTIY
jgi:hypothetical protein